MATRTAAAAATVEMISALVLDIYRSRDVTARDDDDDDDTGDRM